MHLFPVEREQGDGRQEEYSDAAARELDYDAMRKGDRTRQEFGRETDVNVIVNRMLTTGAVQLPNSQPRYTETNFDTDLQAAYTALDNATEAYRRLPAELKSQFPTVRDWLSAVGSGAAAVAFKKYQDNKAEAERKKAEEEAKTSTKVDTGPQE